MMRWFLIIAVMILFTSSISCGSKNNDHSETSRKFNSEIDNPNLSDNERLVVINKLLEEKTESVDSFYLDALWKKSNTHYSLNNYDSVFTTDKLLLKESIDADNIFYQAKASGNLAFDFRENQQYDSAFFYFQKAHNLYLKLNDSTQVGRKLLEMGKIQNRQNDFFGSKETITEAIPFFIKKNDGRYIASALNELGNNHLKLGNYIDAITHYKEAVVITPIDNSKSLFKNNLAIAYMERGDYKEATTILRNELNEIGSDFDKVEYARLLHNLSYTQWKHKSLDVEKEFLTALSIREIENDKRGLISSYTDLGNYYLKSKPIKSKLYLNKAIKISRELRIPKAEIDALKLLMILEPRNSFRKERYIDLSDSLYQRELKVKTQFAKMRYDDQQEKDKILKLENESAQKQIELEKEKTKKIIASSIGSFLLLGGVFLFFFIRQRHKKEVLEKVYNTEKRISQKIHDGLANDIYSIMSAFQYKSKDDNSKLLDKLEDVYKRTRNISHENREIALGASFEIDLKEMLGDFHNQKTNVVLKGFQNINWEEIDSYKCIAIHRVLKELMVNMKKHSKASAVLVSFNQIKNKLVIIYVDNGIGCEPDIKYGVGLQNTENRIKSIEGRFIFDSLKQKGLRITIEIPL